MKIYRTFNIWYFIRKDLIRVAQFLLLGVSGALLAIYAYRMLTTLNPVIDIFPAFIAVAILGIIAGVSYFGFSFWKAYDIIRKSGK